MGKHGPAKKPQEIEILQGMPGRRKLKELAKMVDLSAVPQAPKDLDKLAKDKWNELAPLLYIPKVLKCTDLDALYILCKTHSIMIQAAGALNDEDDFVTPTRVNGLKKNPLIDVFFNAQDRLVKLYQQFGMTPSSRNNIVMEPTKSGTGETEEEAMENMEAATKNITPFNKESAG